MYDFMVLLRKDLTVLKNYFLAIRHNPKRLLLFMFYLAYMIWILAMNSNNTGGANHLFNPTIVGATVMGYASLTLIININVSLKEMLMFFKPADISIVFTSPLKPRAVMMASLIKSTIGALLLSVFLVLMSSRIFMPSGTAISSVLVVFVLVIAFNLSIQLINFIIICIKNHFPIVLSQITLTCIWLLPTLWLVVFIGLDLEAFVLSPSTQWIPIIGWMKGIVLSAYGYPVEGVGFLILLYGSLVLGILCISMLSASDFYEEVIGGTEKFAELRQKSKSGKNRQQVGKKFKIKSFRKNILSIDENKETTENKSNQNLMGELAFYWKAKTAASRIQYHPLFGLKELLYVAGAIVITIFSYSLSDNLKWIPYGYNGLIIYVIFLMTVSGKRQIEFMTPRFLMTPGRVEKKLMAMSYVPVLSHLLTVSIVNLVFCGASQISPLLLLACFAGQMILYIEVLSLNLLSYAVMQNSTDVTLMLPIMKLIQVFALIVPNIFVATLVGIPTNSVILVSLALLVLNTLIIGVLIWLTSWFIKRIEILN